MLTPEDRFLLSLPKDYPTPTINSKLKTKISLFNKLKIARTINLSDFFTEDFSKFFIEVSECLLENKSTNEMRKIVEVFNYFSTVYDAQNTKNFNKVFLNRLQSVIFPEHRSNSSDQTKKNESKLKSRSTVNENTFAAIFLKKLFEEIKKMFTGKICFAYIVIMTEIFIIHKIISLDKYLKIVEKICKAGSDSDILALLKYLADIYFSNQFLGLTQDDHDLVYDISSQRLISSHTLQDKISLTNTLDRVFLISKGSYGYFDNHMTIETDTEQKCNKKVLGDNPQSLFLPLDSKFELSKDFEKISISEKNVSNNRNIDECSVRNSGQNFQQNKNLRTICRARISEYKGLPCYEISLESGITNNLAFFKPYSLLSDQENSSIRSFIKTHLKPEFSDTRTTEFQYISEKIGHNFLQVSKDNFVRVIEPEENEFDFYCLDMKISDFEQSPFFEILEKNSGTNVIKITKFFRKHSIHIMDSPVLLSEFIQYMLKNKQERPFIRKIDSFLKAHVAKALIVKVILLLKLQNLDGIIQDFEEKSKGDDQYFFILCELSKFNRYSKIQILKSIISDFKLKKYTKVIEALEIVARFYLLDKHVNMLTRNVIEKLRRETASSLDQVNKSAMLDLLAKILRPRSNQKDILCPFIGHFIDSLDLSECILFSSPSTKDISNIWIKTLIRPENTNIQNILNKTVLQIFVLKPWISTKTKNLAILCIIYDIFKFSINVTAENVLITALDNDIHKSCQYAKFLSGLLSFCDKPTSNMLLEIFVEGILKLSIDQKSKVSIMLELLLYINENKKYLGLIQKIIENENLWELRVYFKNYLSDHHDSEIV